jgi:quinol monooxygenase YgiN
MHAIVGIWSADESRREEQDRALRADVVPGTAAQPGFLRGYWMRDAETGKVHTLAVFDTEPHALAYKEHVAHHAQAAARVGVTADIVAMVEVSVHA